MEASGLFTPDEIEETVQKARAEVVNEMASRIPQEIVKIFKKRVEEKKSQQSLDKKTQSLS